MTASILLASALVSTLALAAPATSSTEATPAPDIIVIDDLGMHDLPTHWFSDATLVPGDSADRTVLIQNARPHPTTVSVALTNIHPPRDESLLTDLNLRWGTSTASVADVATTPPILVDAVVLAPGERLPISIGYDYSVDVTRIPLGAQTLTFTISIEASDADAGARSDQDVSQETIPDRIGHLATTGAEAGPWWVWALLASAAGWWVIATRRKKREPHEEPASLEAPF